MLSFESKFLIETEVPNVHTGPDDDIAARISKVEGTIRAGAVARKGGGVKELANQLAGRPSRIQLGIADHIRTHAADVCVRPVAGLSDKDRVSGLEGRHAVHRQSAQNGVGDTALVQEAPPFPDRQVVNVAGNKP